MFDDTQQTQTDPYAAASHAWDVHDRITQEHAINSLLAHGNTPASGGANSFPASDGHTDTPYISRTSGKGGVGKLILVFVLIATLILFAKTPAVGNALAYVGAVPGPIKIAVGIIVIAIFVPLVRKLIMGVFLIGAGIFVLFVAVGVFQRLAPRYFPQRIAHQAYAKHRARVHYHHPPPLKHSVRR